MGELGQKISEHSCYQACFSKSRQKAREDDGAFSIPPHGFLVILLEMSIEF